MCLLISFSLGSAMYCEMSRVYGWGLSLLVLTMIVGYCKNWSTRPMSLVPENNAAIVGSLLLLREYYASSTVQGLWVGFITPSKYHGCVILQGLWYKVN